MLAAIRLAERRGKLTGDLSRVQEFALTILMWLEERTLNDSHDDARIDAVKMALLATGKIPMDAMFPEYVQEEDAGELQSDIDPSQAQRIEELLQSGGVLRFDDL